MRLVLSIAIALAFAAAAGAQPKLPNLPPNLMAPTDALSPADERKAFTVPDGFDVQLVASEPDIQKPIQMAFDAKCRLWITTSHHYPFAAQGKASDKLFVLSDIDPNTGKAGKVTVFADDLNIPIGILPLPDCKSCIVSSVGEIRKYTDTNDDGKADKMEVLFKGFGTKDTHGMYNSFTLMPDGWVYACHGFSNDSRVKGKDGHEVHMQSGNTFRFKPDGSRIEVWTHGQVNPFGMAVDPWFNLYTADCHSKPITQLIPGAFYQSFGKPHDGLGYAPHVTHHDHGSTALCGLTWYDAAQFPKEYRGCMFLGNVVTNRINFDTIEWKGATPVAKERPDFLASSDRWFRPADIKLGPDGALYVTDFYNKIIGHYEVPLTDPRRDKDRGRVWRIVWKGKDGKAPVAKFAYSDLTKAKPEELAKLLTSPNLQVRMMATEEACRRGKDIADALTDLDGIADSHVTWVLARTGAQTLPELVVGALLEKNSEKLLAVLKFLAAQKPEPKIVDKIVLLSEGAAVIPMDRDGNQVVRAAVELMAAHPHADFVKSLVALLKVCAPDDTHLRMAAKIALRNCLQGMDTWPQDNDLIYTEMALAIRNQKAAQYLLDRFCTHKIPADKLSAAAEHAARYGNAEIERDLFAVLAETRNADAIVAAFKGVQSRGAKLSAATTKQLLELAEAAIAAPQSFAVWGVRILNALPTVADPATLKLDAKTVQALARAVANPKAFDDVRIGAAEALLRYSPAEAVAAVRKQLADAATPEVVKIGFLNTFAATNTPGARDTVRDALRAVPYRVAIPIALALAGTRDGADVLLTAVQEGKAPPRLLQEKAVLERLSGSRAPDWQKRVADLTKGLPPADQRISALIKSRAAGFTLEKADKVEGAKLFTKSCAACHKIGDMGGKIAPQLDGVGVRGVERLLEDVLDPNRNVDQAFRARVLTLTNDKTLTALVLREEGKVLVVADLEGKEQRIPLGEIATNRETRLSAMPANFADTIPEADLNNIIAYLLDQQAKEPPKK